MGTPTCRRCGTVADAGDDSVPLSWSSVHDGGRVDLICDRCTRDHVRDIEGKLDDAWWS